MPVNKFGHYLHYQNIPHRLEIIRETTTTTTTTPTLLLPSQPETAENLKSICVLDIYAKFQEGSAHYFLDNNKSKVYKFPVNGVIQDIYSPSNLTPQTILFSVREGDPVSSSTLIGKSIQKGDTLRVLRNLTSSSSTRFKDAFLQIVLLCPLIKNEDNIN